MAVGRGERVRVVGKKEKGKISVLRKYLLMMRNIDNTLREVPWTVKKSEAEDRHGE